MTNREYLRKKFFDKLSDWIVKHFKFTSILCLVLDVLFLVFALKVSVAFLALFIPWTSICIGLLCSRFEDWLDEEHKEKNRYDQTD